MLNPLYQGAINKVKIDRKLRDEQKKKVYNDYGFYENYKLVIDPEGMRQFILDEGFTYETLKDFLFLRYKDYHKGISQAIMYQALTQKPWTRQLLSEDEATAALDVVFPREQETSETVEDELFDSHNKIVKTVLGSESLAQKQEIINALKDVFATAEQCAATIANTPKKEWRDLHLLPGVSLRYIIDTVVLTGKHVSRPSKANVGIESLKELLDLVWNLPPQGDKLHVLEKSIGDMLYKTMKKKAPDPVVFCNVFLGEHLTEVAGYPLVTVSRFLGASKWSENTDATLRVMLDVWKFDTVAAQIQRYRENFSVLAADLVSQKAPATLLSDNTLRCLLNIHRTYEKSPEQLKKKIESVLGISRM